MRISLKTFAIVLLIVSSMWLLARLGPPVYCWFVPPKDFQAVVEALENHGSAPATAASAVQQTIASAGPLQRALQIGYYYRAEVAIRVNEKHLQKESQASYIAWFPRLQRPILLILQKQQIDNGAEDYQIAQGDPAGLKPAMGKRGQSHDPRSGCRRPARRSTAMPPASAPTAPGSMSGRGSS